MKKVIIAFCIVLLCSCAVKLRSEFNPVGKLDRTPKNKIVKLNSFEEVSIYLKSSPEGFSLKENELKIEEGYSHNIIGEIEVYLDYPDDILTNFNNSKDLAITELKKIGFEKGANAVIYVVTNISNKPNALERKSAAANGVATGWAVIVEDKYLK